MRVKYIKDKRKYSITIDNVQDIVYLDLLLSPGDNVGKVDFRTTSRGERGEKVKVYLKLKINSVQVDIQNKSARVLGEIIDAPEHVLRGYHSFLLKIGDHFDLYKEKEDITFNILLNKLKDTKSFKVLAVVVDNKEATFGEITSSSIIPLFSIKNYNKKGMDDNSSYYKEICKSIEDKAEEYDAIVIAGPGFFKDEIKKCISCNRFIVVGDTSVTGIVGLREVIKRGLLQEAIRGIKIKEEIEVIEKFFEELKKDSGLAVYGEEYINDALKMGALDIVVICYEFLRDSNIRKILELAEKTSSKIIIIEELNPYYSQIKGLGGVVGILRYEINH